jgi:hypothetical protein
MAFSSGSARGCTGDLVLGGCLLLLLLLAAAAGVLAAGRCRPSEGEAAFAAALLASMLGGPKLLPVAMLEVAPDLGDLELELGAAAGLMLTGAAFGEAAAAAPELLLLLGGESEMLGIGCLTSLTTEPWAGAALAAGLPACGGTTGCVPDGRQVPAGPPDPASAARCRGLLLLLLGLALVLMLVAPVPRRLGSSLGLPDSEESS